jgi:hypothetical protein
MLAPFPVLSSEKMAGGKWFPVKLENLTAKNTEKGKNHSRFENVFLCVLCDLCG